MLRQALKGIWESYSSRLQGNLIEESFQWNIERAYWTRQDSMEKARAFFCKAYDSFSRALESNSRTGKNGIDTRRMAFLLDYLSPSLKSGNFDDFEERVKKC